jgi:hypothetical protein
LMRRAWIIGRPAEACLWRDLLAERLVVNGVVKKTGDKDEVQRSRRLARFVAALAAVCKGGRLVQSATGSLQR